MLRFTLLLVLIAGIAAVPVQLKPDTKPEVAPKPGCAGCKQLVSAMQVIPT